MTRFAVTLLALLATGPAAHAGTPALDPPFASYWGGFVQFWEDWFKNRNAILFTVLVVGVVAIFIITRGKRLK